jgi:hypothetical protein
VIVFRAVLPDYPDQSLLEYMSTMFEEDTEDLSTDLEG